MTTLSLKLHYSLTICPRDLGWLGHCLKMCIEYYCDMYMGGIFLAQLMSCKLKLSLCDDPLSGVHSSVIPSVLPSDESFRWVLPSVNIGRTNLDGKTYRVRMWSVDSLVECLLPILELSHSNLFCGFYRSKFTFPMGKKKCLPFNVFWQYHPLQCAKWWSLPRPLTHTNHLTLDHFSRSQETKQISKLQY